MRSSRRWALGIVLAALAAGGCVYGKVAFTPDSKRFAVVAYADPAEGDAGKEVCELWVTDVASGEHKLAAREAVVGLSAGWGRDGRDLWFLHGPDGGRLRLARWDGEKTSDFAAMAMQHDGAAFAMTPPQVSPDGGVIVTYGVGVEQTRIERIDATTGARIVLASRAGGAVLSPKGDRMAFLAWELAPGEKPVVSVCVSSALGRERRIVAPMHDKLNDVAYSPLVWSPDGNRIAWVDGPSAGATADEGHVVWIADAASGAPKRVSGGDEGCTSPVFSADGAALYWTTVAKGGVPVSVRRADLATGRIETVPGTERCMAAGVSPDGRWLAVRRLFRKTAAEMGGESVVRLVPLDGGAPREDWVSAMQRRACARDAVVAGEEQLIEGDKAAAASSAARAEEAFAAMAKDFPGSESHADVAPLRARIALLRAAR